MSESSHHEKIVLCRIYISLGGQKDLHSFVKVNLFLFSLLKPPLEIKEKLKPAI